MLQSTGSKRKKKQTSQYVDDQIIIAFLFFFFFFSSKMLAGFLSGSIDIALFGSITIYHGNVKYILQNPDEVYISISYF